MEKLNLKSLEMAIATLDEIILRYDNENFDNAIRDAVIQRFEYTYSLAVNMIWRYLKLNLANIEDTLTFNEIIREASKMGLLLSNLEVWTIFRQKRNLSSHTYNENVALDVVSVVKDFQKEVHYLLNQLKKHGQS